MYLSNKNDLKEWFESQVQDREKFRTSFKIYEGHIKGVTGKAPLYSHSETDYNIDDSFGLLWSELMKRSHGNEDSRFTVILDTEGRGIGLDARKTFFLSSSKIGIGMRHQNGGDDFFNIGSIIEDKLKIERLERRIDDLENSAGPDNPINRIIEQFVESGAAMQLIGSAIGLKIPNQADSMTDDNDETEGGLSIETFYHKVRPHFSSDDEFLIAINKIGDMFDQNPEYFKSQING